jgi:excisionase family DNA binding protein
MSVIARQTALRYGSAGEVAAYSGLSLRTVRRMIARGDVRGLKVGRRTVIPIADVERFLESGRESIGLIFKPNPAESRPPIVPKLDSEDLDASNHELLKLLASWVSEGDQDEQREILATLKKALGPHRVASSRKLFP